MSRPGLLHNMSGPPQTVVEHRAPAGTGRRLLFRLPTGIRNAAPQALLGRLDGRRWRRGPAAAEAELRRRIDAHAQLMPLPTAALVEGAPEGSEAVDDLLAVCAVLAKSSELVYLRDKEANVTRIAYGRWVVLRLPENEEKK